MLSFFTRSGEKIFHYILFVTSLVGALTWYAMGSDLGFLVINTVNEVGRGASRQIFYPKYILWVVSFPAYAIMLGLLSGTSWATIVYHVFLAWTWVIGYLVAGFTVSNYKWGFFAFSTIAWMALAAGTLIDSGRHAVRVKATRDYYILAVWGNLLWVQYPLAWGLTDGGNKLGVVAGFIWFGILDVCMIPFASVVILLMARRWDYNRLNIAFTQYGRVQTQPGTFPEKEPAPLPSEGVTGPGPAPVAPTHAHMAPTHQHAAPVAGDQVV